MAITWVATLTRGTATDGKGPKAAQFHPAPVSQRVRHLIKDDIDDALDVLLREVRIFGRQAVDQLGLDHLVLAARAALPSIGPRSIRPH